MKAKLLFTAICCTALMFAQNTFDYTRSWGTYLGPLRGDFSGYYGAPNLIVDPNENIHVNGYTIPIYGLSTAYYNQFLSNGAQQFHVPGGNFIYSILSPTGSKLLFTYNGYEEPAVTYWDAIVAIDQQQNSYHVEYSYDLPISSGTAGTWFTQDPQPASHAKVALSKKSSGGVLLWKTFLPTKSEYAKIVIDDSSNIFVFSETDIQNLATPGTYQSTYNSAGYTDRNTYVAKLNNQGQMVWCSFFPAQITSPKYYNGSLYFIVEEPFDANINYATSNAFQQTKAGQGIFKMNADNGQQMWGTYYNPESQIPINNKSFSLQVTDSGLYVSGFASAEYLPSAATYYGTTGAFQPTISEQRDLFLSKFNHSGSRVWSTYFGNTGDESNSSSYMMDVKGNTVILTGTVGHHYTNNVNISTPGAFSTQPSDQMYSAFFTKFDTNGNRIWTSYYGTDSPGNSTSDISTKMISEESFYLIGSTMAEQNIATPGTMQQTIPLQQGSWPTGFLTKFEKSSTLDTGEITAGKEILLYSNPNNGSFYLTGRALSEQICQLEIFDTSGRKVFHQQLKKNQKQEITTGLSNGNYIVKILGPNVSKTVKMVVSKK